MSTQPSETNIGQPFSEEELASFTEYTPSESEAPKEEPQHKGLTRQEIDQLLEQQNRMYRQDIDAIRAQLTTPPKQTEEQNTIEVSDIPVRFTDDGRATVTREDFAPLVESFVKKSIDKYHQENIAPYEDTVMTVQRQNAVKSAVEFVREAAPDLLEGQDEEHIGKLAIDFYNSGFNTGGDNPNARSAAALNMLRTTVKGGKKGEGEGALPMSTGNSHRQSAAYNQTGRTPQRGFQDGNPYPWERGATVKLKAKSINDLGGLDAYQRYAGQIEDIYRYNDTNNMGWKIEVE